MADALKAAGNKAFAEKKFDEAMSVWNSDTSQGYILISKVRSSPKLSSYNPKTTYFTRIDLEHTHQRRSLQRLWKTHRKPLKSNRTGPRDGVVKAPRCMEQEIFVFYPPLDKSDTH